MKSASIAGPSPRYAPDVYLSGFYLYSTKTSRDVGMVPSVSKEHMCLHGKINWRKNFRNKEGYHSMLNNPG